MWARWIRTLVPSTGRRPRSRPTRRPALDFLEDRTAPAALRIGAAAMDMANAVATDASGNVYVAGSFNGTVDFDPGAGTTTLTSAGSADGFLAKYTSAGALVWVGQLVDSSAQALAVDAAGAVYMTGRFPGTTDFDFGAGVSNLTTGSVSAAYVAKYNPDRSLAWARMFGGQTSGVSGDAITVDAAGNVYSSGVLSNGSADMDPGAGTFILTNTSGNANSYIEKLDPSGNFVWARQFANDPSIAAGVWTAGLGVDSGQNVYVTGIFVGRVDFDPGAGTTWVAETGSGGGDGYAAKLTAAGDLGYVVRMGSASGREDGNGIAVDSAGNAYVTGQFSNTMTIDATAGDTSLSSAGASDLFVMKLNTTGGLDWARRIGSTGSDGGLAITFDGADGLYLTGYYANTVDFDPNAGTHNLTAVGGFTDVFALRLVTDSTFINAWGIGGADYEFGNDVAVTSTGQVAVVGRFRGTVDFDPGPGTLNLTSAGDDDAFVATISQVGANGPPQASDGLLSTNEDSAATGTLVATDPDGDPLTFSLVSTANAHGTVTITNTATGAFTYTPAADYNGTASFTFKASDGLADSNVATVSITINPVNDAPVARDDAYSVNEDVTLTVNAPGVLTNDTDVEGSTLTARLVAGPANGTLTLNANGSFTYRGKPNFNGTDSFTYKANDGSADGNVATVTITVVPVNDAPFPTPVVLELSTAEDTPLSEQVHGRDVDGDAITFSLVQGPDHGALAFNADGTFTYTPAANYFGPDAFVFKVADPSGASNLGGVSITVTPVNDAPTGVADSYSVNEDGSLVISANPVTRLRMVSEAGDWVGQGQTYDYTPSTAAFTGRKNFDNGAEVFVDPPPVGEWWTLDFAAPDEVLLTPGVYVNAMRFPFQDAGRPGLDVSGTGRGSNTLTGRFTVYDVAFNGTDLTRFAGAFEQHSEGNAPALLGWVMFNSTFGAQGGVLANDTDVEADLLLGATLVAGPAHGTFVWRGDGTFTYTPSPNFNGTDTFTYKANDGRADSNVTTVTITVNAVNDAPVAADGSLATDEDTAATGTVTATDVDGDTLTYTVVSGPSHGALTSFNQSTGAYTYAPAANYNGPDAFTFKATDGQVDSNTATVSIAVRAVNDAPVAADGTLTTDEDTPAGGNLTATDVDGDALSFSLVTGPSHGAVVLGSNGAFTYSPAADFNGTDSFTFKASDGSLDSNVATMSITVRPVNDAPVAADDAGATNEDTAVTLGVLGNDTDVDGDALTVSAVTQPAHGTAAINADGTIAYTPAADFNGTDAFTYTVSDGHGGTDTATVTVTVRPVNDAPVARDDSAATDEDTATTIAVLANDTDVDGDALTPVLVAGPGHGTVVLNSDGTFTYTPAANFNGTDTFTYKANDGSADSRVATVFVTVRPVNDDPVAADDSYSTDQGVTLNIPAVGVLANDTDVDGDALSAVLVAGPVNGTLSLNANGSFSYVPNNGFTGIDTFTYKANDGSADGNVATATIRIVPQADTEGTAIGGGRVDGYRRRFNINVHSRPSRNGLVLSGDVHFRDLQNKIRLLGTKITAFHVDSTGTRAVVSGLARVNGRGGYSFTVIVNDLGEPGRGADTFRILISGPGGFSYDSFDYSSTLGLLDGGNLQVRKRG